MSTPGEIAGQLRQTLDRLLQEADSATLTAPARRKLEQQIRDVIEGLAGLLGRLDPIRQPTAVFDPSNPKIIGRFVALALVAQQRHKLGDVEPFYGSGVYAIYYTGAFPLYAPLSGSETPIYVGQAAPAAPNAKSPAEQGDRLARRLDDHRKNIGKATSTISLDDFECRALVVQSGWETAAEDYLIHLFKPIWNSETNILFGIGKHGDSGDTRANKRSPWDTIHPGRTWAAHEKLADAKDAPTIEREVAAHFLAHPVYKTLGEVLSSFIDELRQA